MISGGMWGYLIRPHDLHALTYSLLTLQLSSIKSSYHRVVTETFQIFKFLKSG